MVINASVRQSLVDRIVHECKINVREFNVSMVGDVLSMERDWSVHVQMDIVEIIVN